MKRWKFKLGILAVFMLGLVIGGLGTGYWFTHGFYGIHGPPGDIEEKISHRVARMLDLTDKQESEIRPIVRDAVDQLEALRNRTEPQIHAIIEGALARAKEKLTAEQYVKLERRYDDLRRKWKRQSR